MTDLKATTALGGTTPQTARFGALTLTENSGLALASVALRRGAGAIPQPFGLTLPRAGGWVAGGGVAAFWTGLGQWMIQCDTRAEQDFASEIKALCPGCSVTEQTDAWVAFDITADQPALMQHLLERLVNLDAQAFGPGCATRTALEHMGIFVIRRGAGHLTVLGMRSSAGSLWHALTIAADRLAKKETT